MIFQAHGFILSLKNSHGKAPSNISPLLTFFFGGFSLKKTPPVLLVLEPRHFFGGGGLSVPGCESEEMYFGIPEGECFGYLGLNGAGKTTTMQLGGLGPGRNPSVVVFGWVKKYR